MAAKPAQKTTVHVQLADDGNHTAKVKKVLTTKYNMEQLKKITEFDSWVDDEIEKLVPKGKTVAVEIDFDEWDRTPEAKRKEFLMGKLSAIGDTPARKKFIDEYNKRGTAILKFIHDPSLKRTTSAGHMSD